MNNDELDRLKELHGLISAPESLKNSESASIAWSAWQTATLNHWEDLIAAARQSIWTPVGEGLPETVMPVLVTCRTFDGPEIRVDKFIHSHSDGPGYWDEHDDLVIAWRPLPQPFTPEAKV